MNQLKWTNWSQSFQSFPETIEFPSSETDLVALVNTSNKNSSKIKIIGSGHSCSLIAETHEGTLISLQNYNKILSYDKDRYLLKVQSGISLKAIGLFLDKNNAALSNLGTIDPQSIAGAISTGTHGTGLKFGAMDQQIEALEIITADGEIMTASNSQNRELFLAARVGLGALGIISTVTLKAVPKYNLEVQTKTVSFDEMLTSIPLIHTTDFLRFWWVPHTDKVQLWQADKTEQTITKTNRLKDWIQGILFGNIVHEIGLWLTSFYPKKIPTLNRWMYRLLFEKEQQLIGNSKDLFVLPIHVKQSVMEYGIPIEHTQKAISEIRTLLQTKNLKVHMPIELRFTPENDAFLSMAYKRTTCYIGIISYKPFGKDIPHDSYFEQVHTILKKYEGRPHWAKKHFYTPETLETCYPEWHTFKQLKNNLDPKGMFENNFLKSYFS